MNVFPNRASVPEAVRGRKFPVAGGTHSSGKHMPHRFIWVVGDGLLHGWDANASAKDNLDPTNLVVGDGIGVFEQLVMSGTVL